MIIEDPRSTVQEDVQLHPDYIQGIRHFRQDDYSSALACFKSAQQATIAAHVHARLYLSYVGLTQVLLNDVSGLNLCRQAAQEERQLGEVFENLARAELKLGHRRQACEALRRGLRVDAGHNGLRSLRESIGLRRSPCLGFLDRDNPINRFLGKLTYRKHRGSAAGR